MSRTLPARLRAPDPHPIDPTTDRHPSAAAATIGAPPTAVPAEPPAADRRGRGAVARALTATAALIAVTAAVLAVPSAASAAPAPEPETPGTAALRTVITNAQTWLTGILAAVASLFLVLAAVYWATAGGDPAQVDKAKASLKNALVGYGLAVLAPILLQVVKGIVGG